MQRKPTVRKVTKTTDLSGIDHRLDFETCIQCDKTFETEEWDKHGVTLITGIVYGKHGSVVVVSECPSCFKKSWVHNPISSFNYGPWPKEWKDAVNVEDKVRRLAAIREWGVGICWKCTKLETVSIDTNAWRSCPRGSGPSHAKCDIFVPVKKLPALDE